MFILSSWNPDRPLRMQEAKYHSGVWIYTMTWACTCEGESFISAPKTTPNYLNYSYLGSHIGGTFEMQQPVHAISVTELALWRCHLDRVTHSAVLEPSWPPLQATLISHAGPEILPSDGWNNTPAMPRLWVWSCWRMDFSLFWCWRLPGQRTLCAWPVIFLSQPFPATAGNRTMSSTKFCNPTKCHSCVTVPMCCREHTCHGLGEIQPWLSGSETPRFAAANFESFILLDLCSVTSVGRRRWNNL